MRQATEASSLAIAMSRSLAEGTKHGDELRLAGFDRRGRMSHGTVASSENDASPSICSIARPASAVALSTASQARLHSPRSPMRPQRVYGVSPTPTIQACRVASAIAKQLPSRKLYYWEQKFYLTAASALIATHPTPLLCPCRGFAVSISEDDSTYS